MGHDLVLADQYNNDDDDNNNCVTSIVRVTLFRSICFDTLALSRDLG